MPEKHHARKDDNRDDDHAYGKPSAALLPVAPAPREIEINVIRHFHLGAYYTKIDFNFFVQSSRWSPSRISLAVYGILRACWKGKDDSVRTFTVRYKERNGLYVERVIEALDRRDAFKIAQRHHVNPVSVTEGGVLPKEGEPVVSLYGPGKVSINDRKPWWKRLFGLK